MPQQENAAKPAELTEYPVVIRVPVAWGQMDAFAHLNNTVYFRFFESVRIAYFERMPIMRDPGAPSGVGPILAATSCRYKAPVRYPDTLQVGSRVREVGTDRFTMDYVAFSQALGRVAAVGDGVVVSYDYASGRKVDLPQSWRERIAAIEGSGADVD